MFWTKRKCLTNVIVSLISSITIFRKIRIPQTNGRRSVAQRKRNQLEIVHRQTIIWLERLQCSFYAVGSIRGTRYNSSPTWHFKYIPNIMIDSLLIIDTVIHVLGCSGIHSGIRTKFWNGLYIKTIHSSNFY